MDNVVKYQVRYRDFMSDKPMTELLTTMDDAIVARERIAEEMRTTWVTPDENGLYIQMYQVVGNKYISISSMEGMC